MKRVKFNRKILIPVVSVLVILVLIFSFGKPVMTIEAHYNEYEDKIAMKGIYLVDEKIAYEGETSGIKFNIKNGQKVSKDEKIANNINAPEAGILIYNLDGFENKYTLDNIKSIELQEIDSLLEGKAVKPGIKILNNSQWYLCLAVNENTQKSFAKGSELKISINSKYYSATVIGNFKNSSGLFSLVKMRNDMDITNLHRGFTGYIIKSKHDGILLPAAAVVERNGEKGVLVEESGYAYFRRIKLFTAYEDKVVVYSEPGDVKGIQEYDKVILDPQGLKSGDKVR